MVHAEASARTVEAAVSAAAAKLGLRSDQVDVEVLQDPVPSTFGVIGSPAQVRVTPRPVSPPPMPGTAEAAAGTSPVASDTDAGSGGARGTPGPPPTGLSSSGPSAVVAGSPVSSFSREATGSPATQEPGGVESAPTAFEGGPESPATRPSPAGPGSTLGRAESSSPVEAGEDGPVPASLPGESLGAARLGSRGASAPTDDQDAPGTPGATEPTGQSTAPAGIAAPSTLGSATAGTPSADSIDASDVAAEPASGDRDAAVTPADGTASGSTAAGPPAGTARPRRGHRDEVIEPEMVEADTERAGDFLEGLLDALDIDGDITTWVDEAGGHVELEGSGLDMLVGPNAETLDALQELTRLAVLRQTKRRVRLLLDINGFRARQRERLISIVNTAVEQVITTREAHEFQPMTPAERKIVHDAVAARDGADTESVGEEPNRRVVIRPT